MAYSQLKILFPGVPLVVSGEGRFFARIKWFDHLCSIHLAGAVRLMAALGNDGVSAWEIAP